MSRTRLSLKSLCDRETRDEILNKGLAAMAIVEKTDGKQWACRDGELWIKGLPGNNRAPNVGAITS